MAADCAIPKSIFLIYLLFLLKPSEQVQPVYIGAIFFEDELYIETSFEAALNQFDNEYGGEMKLVPIIKHISDSIGSIGLQAEACDLIDNGVAAIFGPSSKAESDIVSLICNHTGIPHIQFDMLDEETVEEKENHQMTLNIFPSQLTLSKAYADIVQSYGWKKFTIVYDEEDVQAPSRLQDLLQLRDLHNDVVRVRKFKVADDYRTLWKSIKGERRIVLDCSPDLLVDLLNDSIPFGLTGQFNHLFLTNLETYSGNIRSLRDNVTFAVNATAARLRVNGNFYTDNQWQLSTLYSFNEEMPEMPRTLLPNLIYDAVNVFASALRDMTSTYGFQGPRVQCYFEEFDRRSTWPMGPLLMQTMKATSGLNNADFRTSNLQFDEDGQRVNFNIEIYEPVEQYSVAHWDTKGQITPLQVEANGTKKIIYRVSTREGLPYFKKYEGDEALELTGNDRYYGYAVDLIDALAKEVGFEYVFEPAADNKYGNYNPETKQWNGIIGELVNGDAHMGICDLTITQARRSVVDFTVPFMQLGISILAYSAPVEPKHALAFLDPFKGEVWLYVLITIFLMTFLLVFVARISNDEWENPHPCNRDPDVLENQWRLDNTFWLTMGSITTAGSDILPRSASMRTFNGMWWVFAIIIANSYTANLAAFLTNSKMEGTINGIKDLSEQTEVKFGTMYGGSTYTFFADSNETTYRLAFNIMNSDDPSAYTADNKEGVTRVIRNHGNYMFLMETTSIEYNTERDCHLRMVGEKFGEKHYAIAVPLGAEYRSNLSVAILKLSERGELFKLKNKWWKNPNGSCPAIEDASATADMTLEEVRGIFYTLGIGVVLAILVGLGEFMRYAQKLAAEEKISFEEAFRREMKFVLSIWNNKKPVSTTPTPSLGYVSRKSSLGPTKSLRDNNETDVNSSQL